MADESRESRSFSPSTTSANRTQMQGGGVGQRELDLQQNATRSEHATDSGRTASFDTELKAGGTEDHPARADFTGQDVGPGEDAQGQGQAQGQTMAGEAAAREPQAPMLGQGTPANLDVHDLGESDNPELDWGEAGEGLEHGGDHTRRPVRTEAERGQGAKTRAASKDIISRRV